ncbi:hypothetical protein GCM10019016_130770 [Streptomyces prasinosporus]|uniref:ATP-binding protein n=1 Tax=Streptomyces prasinosporus TaxID=68256 RepID=A0ABP6UH42_9ACTN
MDGSSTQRGDRLTRYVRSATLSDVNQEIAETGTRPDGGVRTFSMLLSSTPRGARLARLLAVNALRNGGLPDETAGHVIAEPAANAATHGRVPGRSFRLTLHVVGATLRIEVTDTRGAGAACCGSRAPAPSRAAPRGRARGPLGGQRGTLPAQDRPGGDRPHGTGTRLLALR